MNSLFLMEANIQMSLKKLLVNFILYLKDKFASFHVFEDSVKVKKMLLITKKEVKATLVLKIFSFFPKSTSRNENENSILSYKHTTVPVQECKLFVHIISCQYSKCYFA